MEEPRGDEGAAGAPMAAALDDIAAHLERGDSVAAAGAVARLVAACDAAALADAPLDAKTLADLERRLRRCGALAAKRRERLNATMASLGTGNRAQRAYQQDE